MFDSRYRREGILALGSIRDNGGSAVAVTLTNAATRAAMAAGYDAIALAQIEAAHPELAAPRATRNWRGYVLTLKPFVLGFLVEHYGPASLSDSDVFFYSAPDALAEELEQQGAGLMVADRQNEDLAKVCGRYNDGVLAAAPRGSALLREWQCMVLDWCEWSGGGGGRWGAEGYLDAIVKRPGAAVFRNPGVNLAWWNAAKHHLEERDGRHMVDGHPLVCFHFQAATTRPDHLDGGKGAPADYLETLYRPYAARLAAQQCQA